MVLRHFKENRMKNVVLGALAGVASVVALASPAAAQVSPTTGRLEVRLQVVGGCQFSSGSGNTPITGTTPDASLSFGRVNTEFQNSTRAIEGVVVSSGDGQPLNVTCTQAVIDSGVQLALDAGVNAVGTARGMAGPAGTRVAYSIFRDPGRQIEAAANVPFSIPGLTTGGVPTPVYLYGLVPASGTVLTDGSYTDLVTMTLTY